MTIKSSILLNDLIPLVIANTIVLNEDFRVKKITLEVFKISSFFFKQNELLHSSDKFNKKFKFSVI